MSAIPWARVSDITRSGSSSSLRRSNSRSISGSSKRHAAIMMPAMSPLMAEGTIRRWRMKEGEHFQPGDVLLEIESDIATLDVEACSPGILGKILMPDGSSQVPIEQVIALVARDMDEYALLQSSALHVQDTALVSKHSRPSQTLASSFSFNPSSSSSSMTMRSSSPSRTPRRLSLYEQQMQRGNRHAHVGGPRASPSVLTMPSRLSSPCPMPRVRRDSFTPVKNDMELVSDAEQAQAQASGDAMRRRIVHNLSMRSLTQPRQSTSRDDFDAFL